MPDNYKIVSISQKRQITIPQKYFSRFHFGCHAKISVLDNGILVEPAENIFNSSGEFDVQVLQDLIQQGFNGQGLIEAFKEQREKIPSAIKAMKEEAHNIACGTSDFEKTEDIFGED